MEQPAPALPTKPKRIALGKTSGTWKLPPPLKARLAQYAMDTYHTQTEIVTLALESYLDRTEISKVMTPSEVVQATR